LNKIRVIKGAIEYEEQLQSPDTNYIKILETKLEEANREEVHK